MKEAEQPLTFQQLASQLAAIQAQQASLEAGLAAFRSSTEAALHQLQQQLECINARVAVLLPSSGGKGLAPAGPQTADGAEPSLESPAGCQPKRLSSLHRCYQALEEQLHPDQLALLPQQHSSPPQQAALPTAGAAAAGEGAHQTAAQARFAAGPQQASSKKCRDWNVGYARLLGSSGSCTNDQQVQVQLLRAMAKSGPAWELLERSTAHRLLAAVTSLLREGIALKRLLPWLWPLADPTSASGAAARRFPPELRGDLLAALEAYQLPPAGPEAGRGGGPGDGSPESLQLVEKRDQLLSSLRAIWT